MPVFAYTAINAGKSTINGRIEADSLRDVRESLRKMNLIPTKIQELGLANKAKAARIVAERKKAKIARLNKLSIRDKIDFTNSLYILTKTGIPLIEALLVLEVNTASKSISALSSELRRQILSGSNLSDAISKFPHVFDPVFAGLIKAGEESGELEITLKRTVELLNKQDKLKSRIIATLIYPCFIIGLATIITLVMMIVVFPAFKSVYDSLGRELPLITLVFMNTGTFLRTNWFLVPVVLGTIWGSVYYSFKWTPSRKILDRIALELPVFNTFVKFAYLSNFISILKVSFDAGIPVVDGILLANMTVTSLPLKKALRETATRIQHGQSLSTALKSTGFIPGMIMCMVSTGEEAGQLSETLEQAETYIDTQLERLVEILNKLFEPALLFVIGGIVLALALALYLPLFRTYQNMV